MQKIIGKLTDIEIQQLKFQIHQLANNDKKALAFALILYEDSDVELVKMLNDDDYLQGIERLTGDYINIFYFKVPLKNNIRHFSNFNFNSTTIIETSNLKLVNSYIARVFDLKKLELPVMIFYNVINDKISSKILLTLNFDSPEQAYKEIKSILVATSASIDKINETEKKNLNLIYNEIKKTTKGLIIKKRLKKAEKFTDIFFNLISLILNIV